MPIMAWWGAAYGGHVDSLVGSVSYPMFLLVGYKRRCLQRTSLPRKRTFPVYWRRRGGARLTEKLTMPRYCLVLNAEHGLVGIYVRRQSRLSRWFSIVPNVSVGGGQAPLPSENVTLQRYRCCGDTRALWTLRTPTQSNPTVLTRGGRLGRLDRCWLRERMSSFGPVSAGRSPVFVRPTTGAVSRHWFGLYADVAFQVLACWYPTYGKWCF